MTPTQPPAPQSQQIPVILIAEDDPVLRGLLANHLQKAGYLIVEAGTGEEALQRLRDMSIDVMLTDLNMPKIDGLEVIAMHKFEFPKSPTRFVMMTVEHHGVGPLTLQDVCDIFGIHRRLHKPFDLSTLEQVVREEIAMSRGAGVR